MENIGPYVAYDGTMGDRWTVVVRIWDAAATAWRGIATCGQIASSAMHAISLVKLNGPWPEDAEFRAYPPGTGPGELVWGAARIAPKGQP
jgi:hypothetical protein